MTASVYYPAWTVAIRLKFDESLTLGDTTAPETTESFVARPAAAGGQPASTPLILQQGEANISYILGRIPKKASYELPGYRQAGQFSCDFDFRDLPLDPRAVRAASVEIYTGTIPASDYGEGMMGTDGQGRRRSVLQPSAENLRMVGLVDTWNVAHTDTGSVVSMTGRDLRGVLLDTPLEVSPGAAQQIVGALDWSQPINELVQSLLANNPLFQEITVRVNASEWPNGVIPAPGAEGVTPRNRQGARGARRGGRGTPNMGQGNTSFWDLVVRACYLVGAIPFFRGRDLVIRPTRSIFDQTRAGFDPAIATPFVDGAQRTYDAQTEQTISPGLSIRRMAYGRDTEELTFERKFAGFARPRVVRCVSLDTSSTTRGAGQLVQGRWPLADAPEGARRTRVAPGASGSHEEILNIPVPGVRDAARLTDIARSVFEEIGRGEMGGTVRTRNLASFGGDNLDPDLLSLSPGDGIEFFVDARALSSTPPLVATLTDFTRSSYEEAVQDLEERLGDQNLARVIVASSRGQIQEMQRFFRVSTARFTWDAASGIKIDFDFQNYVVSRNQLAQASDDASAGAVVQTTTRSRTRVSSASPIAVTRGRR